MGTSQHYLSNFCLPGSLKIRHRSQHKKKRKQARSSNPSKMSAPYQPTTELPSNSSTQPESTTSSSSSSTTTTNATASKGQQNGSNSVRKTEAEEAADRLYEERIEEEYAKREGGARAVLM